MNTKQQGNIAEQAVVLKAMELGWSVLKPIGDHLPYDVVIDINGKLAKVQVKLAWFDKKRGNYVVDTRRSLTNQREIRRRKYSRSDFDFCVVKLDGCDVFYIMPPEIFIGYGSEIHFVEADKRQRKPKSAAFREAWYLFSHWAAQKEISV